MHHRTIRDTGFTRELQVIATSIRDSLLLLTKAWGSQKSSTDFKPCLLCIETSPDSLKSFDNIMYCICLNISHIYFMSRNITLKVFNNWKTQFFLQIGKTLPIFTSQKLGLSKINFFFIRDCKKKEIRCFSFSTVHAFCLLVSYTPRFLRQTLAPFFHFVCGFRFPSYWAMFSVTSGNGKSTTSASTQTGSLPLISLTSNNLYSFTISPHSTVHLTQSRSPLFLLGFMSTRSHAIPGGRSLSHFLNIPFIECLLPW